MCHHFLLFLQYAYFTVPLIWLRVEMKLRRCGPATRDWSMIGASSFIAAAHRSLHSRVPTFFFNPHLQ